MEIRHDLRPEFYCALVCTSVHGAHKIHTNSAMYWLIYVFTQEYAYKRLWPWVNMSDHEWTWVTEHDLHEWPWVTVSVSLAVVDLVSTVCVIIKLPMHLFFYKLQITCISVIHSLSQFSDYVQICILHVRNYAFLCMHMYVFLCCCCCCAA